MPLLLSLPLLPLMAGVFVLVLAVMLVFPGRAPAGQPATRIAEYTRLPGSPGMAAETLNARQRLLEPLVGRILALAAGTAPQRVRKAAAAELTMAGSRMNPTVFLGIRGILGLGMPAVAAIVILSHGPATIVHWGALVMIAVLGRRLPSMWLRRGIKARHKAINRALPYALDLMVACLEGGLSLDATLAKVAEQSTGPLPEEIRRTLQEMTLGRPGAEAIRDLGERTGAPDLKRLTENIVQAERMGISLTETMRSLAQDSRVKRRQRAEEMARKAPIKMVPVLIFFILPAIGAILLTPSIIILARVFGSLQGLHR